MKFLRGILLFITALVIAGAVCGCHHPIDEYPEQRAEAWTPTDVETMLGGDDPLEPWNRSMFACTDFLMNYLADPLGRVYTSIFPRPFIEHFNKLCVNLEFPARLMSTLLRAEWRAAGDETMRFFINTTLGIAGLFDVAQSWFGIPSSEADFGSTFAHWGIGPGHSFMLPVAPTLNGRDLIGMLFDSAFDIKTYIPYAGYATFLNRMVIAHSAYDSVAGDVLDPYKNFRQVMLLRKELQIRLWFYRYMKAVLLQREIAEKSAAAKTIPQKHIEMPPPDKPKPSELAAQWYRLPFYRSKNPVSDSMRIMMFQAQTDYDKWYMPLSLFDSSFGGKRSVYKVELLPGRPAGRYGFFPSPDSKEKIPVKREEVVLLLPGIGGALDTGTMTALAEMFHQRNCRVAVFDSTFNWRFILADSNGKLPGYLNDDASRVRNLLKAAIADMKKRKLIGNTPRITLAGYSLGGLHTLKIAAMEKMDEQLKIERFIAINPPVSLQYALTRIDRLVNTTRNWSKSKMMDKLVNVSGKAFALLARRYRHFDAGSINTDYDIEFDDETAKVIAGLYLKLSLRDMILVSHREKPLPGLPEYRWGRRHELYKAIDRISLQEYAEKFLASDYPGKNIKKLLAESGLKAFAALIKDHPGVKIYHNYDDFLLSADEKKWLDTTFKKQLLWFSNGGHLGNLYYLPVQKLITAPFQSTEFKKTLPDAR